jgi:hypothetical protein
MHVASLMDQQAPNNLQQIRDSDCLCKDVSKPAPRKQVACWWSIAQREAPKTVFNVCAHSEFCHVEYIEKGEVSASLVYQMLAAKIKARGVSFLHGVIEFVCVLELQEMRPRCMAHYLTPSQQFALGHMQITFVRSTICLRAARNVTIFVR